MIAIIVLGSSRDELQIGFCEDSNYGWPEKLLSSTLENKKNLAGFLWFRV